MYFVSLAIKTHPVTTVVHPFDMQDTVAIDKHAHFVQVVPDVSKFYSIVLVAMPLDPPMVKRK